MNQQQTKSPCFIDLSLGGVQIKLKNPTDDNVNFPVHFELSFDLFLKCTKLVEDGMA